MAWEPRDRARRCGAIYLVLVWWDDSMDVESGRKEIRDAEKRNQI
jgi:hypothetical protein